MTWPNYSPACRKGLYDLTDGKHSLTGYRSNKAWGLPPCDWSWAYKFEKELECQLEAKHAIAVNSGTMALEAAIFALDLPPGSSIVTSPYTFSATAASIILSGHRPVFADVSEDSFMITPESVKKVITKNTRAILPVDLFGGVADYEGFKQFGLPIISDHCQAVGAKVNGKYTFGDITACSGNGGKNLPMGEGGFCLTDNSKLARRMRLFISHGENFGAPFVGRNGRLPELTAKAAYHGLKVLKERNEHRRKLVERLFWHWDEDLYEQTSQIPPNWIPYGSERESHVFYVVGFTLNPGQKRKEFVARMQKRGFGLTAQYTKPIYRLPALRSYQTKPLPVVEKLAYRTLCLFHDMTPDRPLSYADEAAKAMKESLR